jgi:hypothetical protein
MTTKEKKMIKHGKIHPLKTTGRPNSHLEPIMKFITKGVADARESIRLQPQSCDVKGAKRYNGQQCVIAKAFTRTLKPEAVAIGRSLAYAVFKGLAIRFAVPASSRKLVEEFDQRGRVHLAPITLSKVNPAWRLGGDDRNRAHKPPTSTIVKRTKKIGIRAVGGGISA